MRCPECTQRNSVAARSCKFCGKKFEKKSNALPVKIIGALLGVGLLVGVASAVVPRFGGQQENLKALADKISFGPKSAEEAQKMKVELDAALLDFLKRNGSLPSADLLTKLQSKLPTSIFEVLVFDLPRGMKLVEVDCVLQPSDYLVVADKQGPKVTQLYGLDVFDDAVLIRGASDASLVMLGHTNADIKKNPNVKVISLLPNGNISDRTSKLVPPVKGTGTAAFESNKQDIKLERQLVETALGEELFKGDLKFAESPFKTTLRWKGGRYAPEYSLGSSQFAALYAVATSLTDPSQREQFGLYLNDPAKEFLKSVSDNPVAAPPGFVIAKIDESKGSASSGRRRRRSASRSSDQVTYSLASGKRTFSVTVRGGNGQRWTVASIEETAPEARSETVASQSAPVVETPVPGIESKIVEKQPSREDRRADERKAAEEARRKAAEQKKAEEAARLAEKKQAEKERKAAQEAERKKTASSSGGGEMATTPKRVTMRRGPGHRYGKVLVTSRGERVKVLGKENGWYKISVNGKQGYVYGSYVKMDSGSSAVAEKPSREESRKASSSSSSKSSEKTASSSKKDKNKVKMANGKASKSSDVAVEEPDFVP
ncbi:MAG: SH3 domain-containing protein [Candidatus Obscuribacterales bacterium]